VTDREQLLSARRRTCPATGTSVEEAFAAERPLLSPLPILPEPFDLVVTRTVSLDSGSGVFDRGGHGRLLGNLRNDCLQRALHTDGAELEGVRGGAVLVLASFSGLA